MSIIIIDIIRFRSAFFSLFQKRYTSIIIDNHCSEAYFHSGPLLRSWHANLFYFWHESSLMLPFKSAFHVFFVSFFFSSIFEIWMKRPSYMMFALVSFLFFFLRKPSYIILYYILSFYNVNKLRSLQFTRFLTSKIARILDLIFVYLLLLILKPDK